MSRAALLVALLLALHGLWPLGDPPPACEVVREVSAEAGHSSAVACGAGAPLRGPGRLLYGQRLDANRADSRSLEALPGIGPARAAALVAERARGPFCGSADLERVRGIGPATAARIAPLLAFSCPG